MSERVKTDELAETAYTNGAAELHIRVADLLDDVTVAALPDKPAVAGAAPENHDAAPGDSLMASISTYATLQPPAPASTPPDTADSAARTGLPGEPLVWSVRRSTGTPTTSDLPPFLQQQPAAPEADVTPSTETGEDIATTPAAETPKSPLKEPTPPPSPAMIEPARDDRDQPAPANQILNIRGRSDGVAIEVGRGAWSEVLAALSERLGQSASFFRNSSVALDIGARPVVEDELQQIANVLTAHEMKLGVVRTSSERAFQAALAAGMTVTLESTEGATVAAAATAITSVAGRGTEDASYFVYKGYLRSGHRLRRQENILVIGDINPGAEVISDGDVLVWGRLRGIVHAGAAGNRRALVAALDLEPTQMRIADVTTIGPDPRPGQPGRFFWRRSQHKRPEIARLVQQDIVIEEWDASRPGGFVSLRRGAG